MGPDEPAIVPAEARSRAGAKQEFPVQRLCKVQGVSQSSYFAWRDRPVRRRQQEDIVLLAHVRSAFAISIGTYGSPRMTCELRARRPPARTARLMRENGLTARQKRRFKRATDDFAPEPSEDRS
jgi:putative transposase